MYKLNDWHISDDGLSEDDVLQNGNRLLTGNGYLGRRGVVDEAPPSDMPAVILSGIYDKRGDLWREPVNSPDPLYTLVCVDGKPLTAGDERTVSHEQALDFRCGIYSRSTSWNADGNNVTVKAQRYAHMEDVHLLCMRYVISAGSACKISVKQGINCAVRDLNGPHLGDFVFLEKPQRIKGLSCETLEKKIPLSVFSAFVNDKMQYIKEEKISNSDDGIFSCLTFDIINDTEIELIIYGA
ncbi:MAG: hypothetical protein FWC03_12590, partial [Treponema sp.]|nr:hypothetical protein [Treponema sp.]